jgi:hypothetical protein
MRAGRFISILALILAMFGCGEREYEYPSGYRVTLFLMGGVFSDYSTGRVHGGIMQPTALKDVPQLVPNEPFLRMESPFAVWNTDPYGYGVDYTPDSIIDRHLTLYAIYGKYVYDEEALAAMECGNPDVVYVLSNNIIVNSSYWRPLCSESRPFRGKLYGKGYTIVFTSNPPVESGGLFAYMSRANVSDLNINATVRARRFAGAVAGVMDNSTINRVRATGTVHATSGATGGDAGGLAGRMSNSRILFSSFGGNTLGLPTSKVSASGSSSYVGSMAGYAVDSEIKNVISLSDVSIDSSASGSNSSAAGGLAGYMRGGEVRDSIHTGQVTAADGVRLMIGGLVGRSYEAQISGSMAQTIVHAPEGSDSIAGGIVGFAENTLVANSLAAEVSVRGASAGRIVGLRERGGTYSNNFARDDMNINYKPADDNEQNGGGVSFTEIYKSGSFYRNTLGWDFRLHWIYPEHYPYPRSKWETEYLPEFTPIYTAEELAEMEQHGWYVLMTDIDLALYGGGRWRAAGGFDSPFSALLDGNGHTIYNLSNASLFGYTNTLTVYDLNLSNINSTYGGVAATSNSFFADRVRITGRVGQINGGGLIGSVNYGKISYCSFDGDAHEDTPTYANDITGGLIGTIRGGIVTYSYSAGVTGAYSDNDSTAGGFVGRAVNSIFITNYALTDVYSTGSNFADAGGFAGYLDNATVVNAYVYGNVYGAVRNRNGGVSRSGGFAGEIRGRTMIRNAAAFGESMRATYFDVVAADSYASPFAAQSVAETVFDNIHSNHSAILTADDISGIRGANIGVTPPDTFYEDDLKMDFRTVWRMPNNYEMRRYPVFRWENEHIYRAIGEEWYWFGVSKNYEDFQ